MAAMIFSTPDQVQTSATGCCIRFGPDGIYLHHNTTHYSVGVEEGALTYDTRGRLVVRHKSVGQLVTMGAFADETLTARGIALGCSGGASRTTIQVARKGVPLDLRKSTDYDQVAGEVSNAWLFWLHATPRDSQ